MSTFDPLRILDFVYREWFRNHDRDTEVSFSRLFGKLSCGSIPPVNSMEVAALPHVTLCEQMRMLEKRKQIRENGLYMYSEKDALQYLHCD